MVQPVLPLREPGQDDLNNFESLYLSSRFLDAFELSKSFLPLQEWQGLENGLLASRLASVWGDQRLSDMISLRVFRKDPNSFKAIYGYARRIMNRHGLFEALAFLRQKTPNHLNGSKDKRYLAYLWLFEARLLSYLRDFDAAEVLVEKAAETIVDDAWFWVEKSCILERQDRYVEAHTAALEALRIEPDYSPALTRVGSSLQLLGRAQEAFSLLSNAVGRVQCGRVPQHLAPLQMELKMYKEAGQTLDLVEQRLPLADVNQRRWLAGCRTDVSWLLDDHEVALKHAKSASTPYYDKIADRLEKRVKERRVFIDVEFVRQHHMTCAPATLAALGQFWGCKVDHEELARLICYDGTPGHEERNWAEKNGWAVREFRVTWEIACALLDRGCPFTLTTVAVRSAHLQAVVGYDGTLGTFRIRDPYQLTHGDCIVENLLTASAGHGPRGMVLVPKEREELLVGLDFPEAAQYDHLHALERALVRHDRVSAQSALELLEAISTEHRLTLQGVRSLAAYDGNWGRFLEATDALLKQYPGETNFTLDQLTALAQLGRRKERFELLAQAAHKKNADPIFWRDYAAELYNDARNSERVLRLLRRALRRNPGDAGSLRTYADALWGTREFQTATANYRLAASLDDKNEDFWRSYFIASRHVGQSDVSLALLRKRFEKLGPFSAQPARTLFSCYDHLDRGPEAFQILEDALKLRPADGDLILFSAECFGRFGERERAKTQLQGAVGWCSRRAWLRSAGRLANYFSQHKNALELWRELLDHDPLDLEANRAVVDLLNVLEGRSSAVGFLDARCGRHPHAVPLHKLRLEWLRDADAARALEAVDHVIAQTPYDSWALREKALILSRIHRHDESLVLAEKALVIEPNHPSSYHVKGTVLQAARNLSGAREVFTDGIRCSLDWPGLIVALVAACGTHEERIESIRLIRRELESRPSLGEGYLEYYSSARGILPPEELSEAMGSFWTLHPEHWQAWSACAAHLRSKSELSAALEKLLEATRRFPLIPRLWSDLALVHAQAGEPGKEVEALERALVISPDWSEGAWRLADAYSRQLRIDDAVRVLRRVIAANPLSAHSHHELGVLQAKNGNREEGITLLERALKLNVEHIDGWEQYAQLCVVGGEASRALEFAKNFTEETPGNLYAWLAFAHRLRAAERKTESYEALSKVIELNPGHALGHETMAYFLAMDHRFDEALSACSPIVYNGRPPLELRGRAAWVERMRGEVVVAIERMNGLLKDEPQYAWGWETLAEWNATLERWPQALEATKKRIWLRPDDAIGHGILASVYLRTREPKAAKEALQRALLFDPAYTYASEMLFNLYLDDAEVDVAKLLLKHIALHQSKSLVAVCELRLKLREKDFVAADQLLEKLCIVPQNESSALATAMQAYSSFGRLNSAEKILFAALARPEANLQVGEHWVNSWAGLQSWGKMRKLKKAGATQAASVAAWAAYVNALVNKKQSWRLRWIYWRKGDALRKYTETWAALGYALASFGHFRSSAKVMADWRGRAGLQPWMLFNLNLSLYCLGRNGEAEPVTDAALGLPADHTYGHFLMWKALVVALDGKTAEADSLLARVDSGVMKEYPKTVHFYASLLVSLQNTPCDQRRIKLKEIKNDLSRWTDDVAISRTDKSLVVFRSLLLRRLGRDAGSGMTELCGWFVRLGWNQVPNSASKLTLIYVWIGFVLLMALRGCLDN